MRKILFVLCLGLLFGCKIGGDSESFGDSGDVGENRIHFDSLVYNYDEKVAFYQGVLFSGVGFTKYENGQLWIERNYSDGKEDGLERRWYKNSQLEVERNYSDGKEDGLWKKWYENGQLEEEINYSDGKEDGLWKKWYENGQLMLEGNYKDGKDVGLYKEWYENGQLFVEINFKEGEVISKKCWTEYGDEWECP